MKPVALLHRRRVKEDKSVSASDDDRIAYLAGEAVEPLADAERAQLDELRALLKAPATWSEPDPGLEAHVVDAIAAEARAAPVSSPRLARRRPMFGLRSALRRPAYALTAAALAAATVGVVVALDTASPAAERLAMVVTGTELAPGAHGSAALMRTGSGWRINLSATGLPHLANGRYYEAWLKNAAAILVPIGTFNDARHVTLWAGVPATEFRTLTVTQQEAGASPASSGERVLIGTISVKH